MKLYHTGNAEIRKPDIFLGRENADFGQGFYLTPDAGYYREQQEAYAATFARAMEEILGDSDG